MTKFVFILGLLFTSFACYKKNDSSSNTTEQKKTYSIESTTYWDNPKTEKDTIRFIVVKVDTINHLGSSIRYSQNGKIFEQIVILDKTKALKLEYSEDTISLITPCKYYIRKDHPSKEFYSIVAYK
jgi:hypothetical protein